MLEMEQYFSGVLAHLGAYRKRLTGPKRLLVLRLGGTKSQALLLSREGEIYGVEECCALTYEQVELGESFQNLLDRVVELWRLEQEKPTLAIWLESIYQEEFVLPGLQPQEMSNFVKEEAKTRIPWEEGTYLHNYVLQKREEEYLIRLAAVDKQQFEVLQEVAEARGFKLGFVAGELLAEDEGTPQVEFWNCFCDKEKEKLLQEEYGELIAFGIGCLAPGRLVNLLPQEPWWQKSTILKPMLMGFGGVSLLVVLLGFGWVYWQQWNLAGERRTVELKLQELEPWEKQRQIILKLQQDLKQKEQWYKQLNRKETRNYFWLELLGKVMPAGCWLTSLEEQGEGLLLRGRALEADSVELLRRQLLSFKECKGCELVECKQEQIEERLSFIMRVKK